MFNFKDKVVVVTGAGAGIGASAAMAYAKDGAKVVANGRSESARAVAEEICAAGYEAFYVQGDVGDEEQVKRLIDETVEKYGKIDIVVNCACLLYTSRCV